MPYVCVIDPGHGGSSAGGTAVRTDPLEKEAALDVALRLKALLEASGIQATLTRSADSNVALEERPLVSRRLRADVFLSIHFNGSNDANDRSSNGTSTYVWKPPDAKSLQLARAVHGELLGALGLKDRKVNQGHLLVLNPRRHDPGTACCLAEVSFLTCSAEEERLRTDAYRERIAHALAAGVASYLGVRSPAPALPRHRTTPAAPLAASGIAAAREQLDIWHEVPLVAQGTGMSCWAAAAAMIVGWRDRLHVEPLEVARAAGRWREYREGLQPHDVPELARTWGLQLDTATIREPRDLARLLSSSGPLWVGEASPGLHSVVVTGLHGDGTPGGTLVRVADPWPMERGERYSVPFADFVQNLNAAETDGGGTQILHASGRGAGSRREMHVRESFVARFGRPNPDSYLN